MLRVGYETKELESTVPIPKDLPSKRDDLNEIMQSGARYWVEFRIRQSFLEEMSGSYFCT